MNAKADTPHKLQHEGEEVPFCSAGCKEKFAADPVKYQVQQEDHSRCAADGDEFGDPHRADRVHAHANSAPSTSSRGVKWTCPMHPEIVRDGPGSCPICGMALEPMTPSADAGPNPELMDMTRHFWIG